MRETLNMTDKLYDLHASEEGLFRTSVGPYPMASLFRYGGLLRKLILDFKIKGRWHSGILLVEIFGSDGFVQDWMSDADFIMAVPSSFWGRWQGKHDLAFALAERLSANSGVPLLKAPRTSFFRFKKQSFQPYSDRLTKVLAEPGRLSKRAILKLQRQAFHGTNSEESHRPLIVLVDDIVTSGQTLERLAHSMPLIHFRFLTLATAYRDRLCED